MSKRWTESLPCVLTSEELLERGEALALQEQHWHKTDGARKAAADRFKKELEEIDAESSRLAMIVRDKSEPRPVWVVEVRDYKANSVDIVREDTGEVVKKRVMTEHERQMELVPTIEAENKPQMLTPDEFRERLEGAIGKAQDALDSVAK